MTYQVLARKWRPKNFTSLVEQTHVVRALVHALEQQRLHHGCHCDLREGTARKQSFTHPPRNQDARHRHFRQNRKQDLQITVIHNKYRNSKLLHKTLRYFVHRR